VLLDLVKAQRRSRQRLLVLDRARAKHGAHLWRRRCRSTGGRARKLGQHLKALVESGRNPAGDRLRHENRSPRAIRALPFACRTCKAKGFAARPLLATLSMPCRDTARTFAPVSIAAAIAAHG